MTVAVLFDPSSPAGEPALAAGVAEARRRSAGLVVITALTGAGQDSQTQLVEDGERAALRQQVSAAVPSDVQWSIDAPSPGVDAVGAVLERVAVVRPELVVVGRRPRSAVGKLLLGRTQQRLLLELTVPILLVTSS